MLKVHLLSSRHPPARIHHKQLDLDSLLMPFEDDPLAFFGRCIIQDYHTRLRAKLSLKAGQSGSFRVSEDRPRSLPEKVGILGAGIGGLYAALILDSLDIEYEILEASDRTGGRMCTYEFPGGGIYDYYVRRRSCPTHSFNAHILYPRMQAPCDSHFRRRIAKDAIRMGS